MTAFFMMKNFQMFVECCCYRVVFLSTNMCLLSVLCFMHLFFYPLSEP